MTDTPKVSKRKHGHQLNLKTPGNALRQRQPVSGKTILNVTLPEINIIDQSPKFQYRPLRPLKSRRPLRNYVISMSQANVGQSVHRFSPFICYAQFSNTAHCCNRQFAIRESIMSSYVTGTIDMNYTLRSSIIVLWRARRDKP